MARILLITGGARSGKSTLAEARTLELGSPAHYIATAQAFDAEMEARIALHRARRGPEWRTHAEPLALRAALCATDDAPRLVDCLTLWLTNLMLGGHDWEAAAREMIAALPALTAPVVFVSNEVGLGIVPDNRLSREFRDAAGFLNQWVAAAADEVIFTVAGLPMKVK
ncbi:MAG: bifunctional adenosylcobinamide kinase/adenosylcobinamide-phosphate guanylyltransferase [Paenirhodobacter sp.]|uniref:bifunctional adenosylcobinamide kinase/adenosylcobinamide-phosphate guanylyltransferase n=1 Tax=Paenirhodobacter sp. TaxID=1965326 RepID=UPI003D09AD4F